jgi:hypothetical protein
MVKIMNKKIVVQNLSNLSVFTEYFDFNGIPYDKVELYQSDLDGFGRYDISGLCCEPASTILIVEIVAFRLMLKWTASRDNIIDFVRKKNKIIVWQDIDAGLSLNDAKKEFLELDPDVFPGSVMYISDMKFSARHWTNGLTNSLLRTSPYNVFMRLARQHHSGLGQKSPDSYPYMITTILKKKRSHRTALYNQLTQNKLLFEKGLCIFHNGMDTSNTHWRGITPCLAGNTEQLANSLYGAYPSMDLYKNSFLEIVPECCYKQVYEFTEKTAKPISTKTPFLVVSNMGYLDYLRSLGFRTFDSLISEQYDLEHRVQDRIRLMLEQLEDIIKNGAQDFYLASMDILEHNQKRLAEITGFWNIHTDEFFTQCLAEIDQ